jgi:hypothetical protein
LRITNAGVVVVGGAAVEVFGVDVVVVDDEVVAVSMLVFVAVVEVSVGTVAVCVLVAGGEGAGAAVVVTAVIVVAGAVAVDVVVVVLAGTVVVRALVALALKTVEVLLQADSASAVASVAALNARVRGDRIRSFSYPGQIPRGAQEEAVEPVLTGQLGVE